MSKESTEKRGRGRPRRFTGPVIKDLMTVADAGMTLDEIASVTGSSTVAVRNALISGGYEFRNRGPRTGTKQGYLGTEIGFAPTKVDIGGGESVWVLRTPSGFHEFASKKQAQAATKELPVSPQDAAKALARVKNA